MINKNCIFCGKEILDIKPHTGVRKYCSKTCAKKYRLINSIAYTQKIKNLNTVKYCLNCGNKINIKEHTNIEKLKFCSYKCCREYWYKNNPNKRQEFYNKRKAKGRLQDTLRKFNLTVDEFNILNNRQKGRCAICGRSLNKGKRLCVDHNHITNTNRGLLCSYCNIGIGHFKDNIFIMFKAIWYISKYNIKEKLKHKGKE